MLVMCMILRQVTTVLGTNLSVKFVSQAGHTSGGTDLGTVVTLVAFASHHHPPYSSESPYLGASRVPLCSGAMPVTAAGSQAP